MLLKLAIAAALVWWFFLRGKANAATGVIQPEGQPDFDPVTADQLNAVATHDVSIGDEWSATYMSGAGGGDGNLSDYYRTHANENLDFSAVDSGAAPALRPESDDSLLREMAAAL